MRPNEYAVRVGLDTPASDEDILWDALYDEHGRERKVMLADGRYLTPRYASLRWTGRNVVNAVVRPSKGMGVSGLVYVFPWREGEVRQFSLFEPHPYGKYAKLCPSWQALRVFRVFDTTLYDIGVLSSKIVNKEILTLDEHMWLEEYYARVLPPTTS